MILTGPKIASEVRRGRITIAPFRSDLLNPNSYNYRLGKEIVELGEDGLPLRYLKLASDGFRLRPAKAYLGSTLECIGSRHYVTLLGGRSSMGRLGVYLNYSADLGHIGSVHQWTLEIAVVQPIRVYPGMQVGQATFWQAAGSVDPYSGYYGMRNRPTPNRRFTERFIDSDRT